MSNILIVDNEENDVEGLIHLLNDVGCFNDHVGGVEEALTLLRDNFYDALIIDFHLGGLDDFGLELDGDYLLFLLDGNFKAIIENSTWDNEDLTYLINETFGSFEEYQSFVKDLNDQKPKKIIFSGSYLEGHYPEESVDYIIRKGHGQNARYCEEKVIRALVDEGILDGEKVQKTLSGVLDESRYFHEEMWGTSEEPASDIDNFLNFLGY